MRPFALLFIALLCGCNMLEDVPPPPPPPSSDLIFLEDIDKLNARLDAAEARIKALEDVKQTAPKL